MNWRSRIFNDEVKRLKHARVSLHKAHCQDCGRELRTTHVVYRFGGRCRPCWSAFHTGAVEAVG